jgi:hypothetical protein
MCVTLLSACYSRATRALHQRLTPFTPASRGASFNTSAIIAFCVVSVSPAVSGHTRFTRRHGCVTPESDHYIGTRANGCTACENCDLLKVRITKDRAHQASCKYAMSFPYSGSSKGSRCSATFGTGLCALGSGNESPSRWRKSLIVRGRSVKSCERPISSMNLGRQISH